MVYPDSETNLYKLAACMRVAYTHARRVESFNLNYASTGVVFNTGLFVDGIQDVTLYRKLKARDL